jgi:hypothetical protein
MQNSAVEHTATTAVCAPFAIFKSSDDASAKKKGKK